MSENSYNTIRTGTTFEMKEKGSRFISRAFPARTRNEAESFVAAISKQYFDATHNCFAYCLGTGQDEITRFSDDGEPSGTAGKPILQAIQGHAVTNLVVVVTRYFGGTKLGTGGLIRAYGGAASSVLDQAEVLTVFFKNKVSLECSYHHLNTIMALVEKSGGTILESEYGENIKLTLELRQSLTDFIVKSVVDKTAGQVIPEIVS